MPWLLAAILSANPHCPVPQQMAAHLVKPDSQVPARIMEAMIWEESRWDPKCRGTAGEVGLCQIHPVHRPPRGWTAQMDWSANHLQILRKKGGTWEVALAAYNGGWGGRNHGRCRRYAARVLRRAKGVDCYVHIHRRGIKNHVAFRYGTAICGGNVTYYDDLIRLSNLSLREDTVCKTCVAIGRKRGIIEQEGDGDAGQVR